VSIAPTFGLVVPQAGAGGIAEPGSLRNVVDAADALGPDSGVSHLWVSDHLLWWRPMYESLTLLAAIAGRTSRVEIGTAVLLLALRPPLLAAKTLASIDRLSGGRLTVGVGVGGEYAPEWEASGVERRGRGRRTDDMIRTLRRLWGDDPVGLQPKPHRPPPVWIGGRSEAALRRAGRLGDGWMGLFTTPARYATQLEVAREAATRADRDPASLVPSLYVWTCIRDSEAEARAAAASLLPSFYQVPFEKLERYLVMGTADRCAEAFSAFADAGVRHFAVAPVVEEVTPELVHRLVDVAARVR
jgi:alkanesulfonate monooxygenase SsuD/methylene tetrahydromethanopterin reductase-like flavin-dependent oxidoreductase (luciferase family)